MRRRALVVVLLVLAVLPLADHADQATCCNATGSLASTAEGTVAGDEAFFKLPTGPSNVMFLLDTSGSMLNLPACGDSGWDAGGLITCNSPSLSVATPSCTAASTTSVSCTNAPVMVTGTCAPDTDKYTTSSSNLTWMESVKPQTGYADPGRTNSLLWDCPLWGNGGSGCGTRVCSGDGCLFDPAGYYLYSSWSIGGSSPYTPTAKRYELDGATGTSSPSLPACTALDSSGNPLKDYLGNLVSLGSACTTCMQNHGFYIYKVSYVSSVGRSGKSPNYTYTPNISTVGPVPLFKGTFLNAYPPKFVAARQVIKSVAWMDPANPSKLDQVRLGLTILNQNSTSVAQGKLIVPLGPDKNGSYPPTQSGFRQARQYILSALNDDPTRYLDPVSGATVCDGSTGSSTSLGFQYGFFNPASGGTPLGSVLFNIGQYFTQAVPPGSTNLYTALFGSTGCKTPGGSSVSCIASNLSGTTVSEFAETSPGRTNAAWVTKAGNTSCSFCWGCQSSSVVVVTDGSPNDEIGFPTTISNGTAPPATFDTPAYGLSSNCNGTYAAETTVPGTDTTFKCTQPNDGKAAGVPRIADWLHTLGASGKLAPKGLRYDMILGGSSGNNQRVLTVDTIGLNVANAAAVNILNAIAEMAGGVYQNTSNVQDLTTAVYNAVNRVTPKDISFSAATSNSLQTVQTTASQAFITRFRPNTMNSWEGHVFEAFLFDEFLNGCDPTKSASAQPTVSCGQTTVKSIPANNFSGTNACNGTFLIDLDCDQIVEDAATGNFLKKGTSSPANLPWDAGQVLSYQNLPPVPPATATTANSSYRSADETATSARSIFTWIGGKRVDLTGANAATIQPYLNIGSSWCTSFLAQIGVSGGTNPTLECAKQVIWYVRGWDVLDQDGDGCGGPDNPKNTSSCQRGTKGEERDRDMDGSSTPFFWKLGDISHSSPAVMQAPIDEIRCDTGYEKQCTWAIHSPAGIPRQTPMDTSCPTAGGVPDCYQDYRNTNITRRRVLLVGSNDGMLHAFDAGNALTSQPPDITGNYAYSNGTGAELWAFVPPDLLPRLKDLLSAHQYMVDGSIMLRDVWVDGSGASDGLDTPAAPTGADGVKQTKEFHTVAIFGRRSGGNQYSALDVTNPAKPTFLWNFPQSGSDDSRYMGESWADFAPRPPPIVPVKMAPTSASPGPDQTRGFSERWAVLLGGGYDPVLTLGRAVFMLDAWTGQTLWRFTDDDFKANMGFSGSSALPSMFPVPASPAAVDIGDPSTPTPDKDGFFDTATWGDTGGNLWVARFWAPGVVDATTGRVDNWFAARAFEELRRTDDVQVAYDGASGATRNEFFYMTANVFEPSARMLHTYLGSGDREQLMAQGATCGTDDLFACCQAGCSTVKTSTTESYGACNHSDTFSCVGGVLTHSESNNCPAGGATCAAAPGNGFSSTVNIEWDCPSQTILSPPGSATCDGSGLCTVVPVASTQISGTFRSPSHRRFYGVASFGGGIGTKTFGITNPGNATTDKAAATAFDQNRLTDVPYTGTCNGGGTGSCTLVNTTQAQIAFNSATPQLTATTCAGGATRCTATALDPGWYYEYGDYCPLQSCTSTPPWTDEKTGSGPNVVLGCVNWPSFRPYGVSTSTDPCSGAQGVPTVYDYAADYVTGAPSGYCYGAFVPSATGGTGSGVQGQGVIASQRSITAAPGGGNVRVDVTKSGQIGYGVLNLDSGSAPTTTGSGSRSAQGATLYWLEVPQQLHQCRHVDPANCN